MFFKKSIQYPSVAVSIFLVQHNVMDSQILMFLGKVLHEPLEAALHLDFCRIVFLIAQE
jgi:hypothetical protein